MIHLIAILSRETRAIGKNGGLIWNNPTDLARFRELTRNHPVLMGSKTWLSIPPERRPLPKRANFVVSRDPDFAAPGATVVTTVEEGIERAKQSEGADEIWVIGGGVIYSLALPYADRLDLTLVDDNVEGDAYFPEFPGFEIIEQSEFFFDEDGKRFQYVTYGRPSSTS